jgi:hypothetical protein
VKQHMTLFSTYRLTFWVTTQLFWDVKMDPNHSQILLVGLSLANFSFPIWSSQTSHLSSILSAEKILKKIRFTLLFYLIQG